MVTVLQVRARFIDRGKARAKIGGRLCCLGRSLFLGCSLEEFLEFNVVLSRFGQQGWRVLLGKQAHLGHSTVCKIHEHFSTL